MYGVFWIVLAFYSLPTVNSCVIYRIFDHIWVQNWSSFLPFTLQRILKICFLKCISLESHSCQFFIYSWLSGFLPLKYCSSLDFKRNQFNNIFCIPHVGLVDVSCKWGDNRRREAKHEKAKDRWGQRTNVPCISPLPLA